MTFFFLVMSLPFPVQLLLPKVLVPLAVWRWILLPPRTGVGVLPAAAVLTSRQIL